MDLDEGAREKYLEIFYRSLLTMSPTSISHNGKNLHENTFQLNGDSTYALCLLKSQLKNNIHIYFQSNYDTHLIFKLFFFFGRLIYFGLYIEFILINI